MGRAEVKKARVNMDELVSEALKDARRDTEGRVIEWETQPLPAVLGDRSMLKQVWVNLLSNAVKYTRPKERARILVRCAKNHTNEWQFSVQDNGAGFTAEAAEKAVAPFFTTRNVGLGLGLTVSRKIIEVHQGRLQIEPPKAGQHGLVRISLPL